MRIVVATGNAGKLKEVRDILSDVRGEIVSLAELGMRAEAEENGETFSENAEIKAREIHDRLLARGEAADTIVLADDSGLCIDFLDGAPGVHSARFLGHDTPYHVKNAALLEKLSEAGSGARGARFVCAICAVLPDGTALHTEAVMEGEIAEEESGANGFGYDPIFYLPAFGKTAAELSDTEKNCISHRAKALFAMRERLKGML